MADDDFDNDASLQDEMTEAEEWTGPDPETDGPADPAADGGNAGQEDTEMGKPEKKKRTRAPKAPKAETVKAPKAAKTAKTPKAAKAAKTAKAPKRAKAGKAGKGKPAAEAKTRKPRARMEISGKIIGCKPAGLHALVIELESGHISLAPTANRDVNRDLALKAIRATLKG